MRKKDLYLYNHFAWTQVEKLYIILLQIFRNAKKHPILSIDKLEELKNIAKRAFPENLQQICDIDSIENFLYYCHCYSIYQIYYLITENWYVIVGAHHNCYELVECADANRNCRDIYKIINYLKKYFSDKPMISDCRESTSLPLFRALEKHKRIIIDQDIVRERNGEVMHYIKCRLNIARGEETK